MHKPLSLFAASIFTLIVLLFSIKTVFGVSCPEGMASATDLIISPALNGYFTTSSGACVIDPQAAPFLPFRVPSYEELKSLYFDQTKSSALAQFVSKTQLTGDKTGSDLSLLGTKDKLYYITGSLTISPTNPLLVSPISPTGIVFVDKELNISTNIINSNENTGLVFVVKGNIIIDETVTQVDAILISAGYIYTAGAGCLTSSVTTSDPLTINGTLVTISDEPNIKFCRKVPGIGRQPGEIINHQPKYLVILRNSYSDIIQRWAELDANAIIPSPAALPSPLPLPSAPPPPPLTCTGLWSANYYDYNPTTQTKSTFRYNRCESVSAAPDYINYNWGLGGPDVPEVGTENFYIEWTGQFNFTGGTYQFTIYSDDGMRLYIDNTVVVESWKDQGPSSFSANKTLSGLHNVKIEYYEHTGGALAKASWVNTSPPSPSPSPSLSPSPLPSGTYSTPIVDSSSTKGGLSVSSLTWSHTVGASSTNRLLIVGVGMRAYASVSGITYAGRPLTRIGTVQLETGDHPRAEMWYLINPPTGTNNVVLTLSMADFPSAGAISISGVNQTSPLKTWASASGNSITSSLTVPSAANNLVLDILSYWNNAGDSTPGSGQTIQWRSSADNAWKMAGSTKEGSTSVTTTWNLISARDWAAGGISISPAATLPTSNPLTIDSFISILNYISI